jgi:hypothetical protein
LKGRAKRKKALVPKMAKKDPKHNKDSAEQVSPEEALKRMSSFKERKDKFVAAIKKSKDRDISA